MRPRPGGRGKPRTTCRATLVTECFNEAATRRPRKDPPSQTLGGQGEGRQAASTRCAEAGSRPRRPRTQYT